MAFGKIKIDPRDKLFSLMIRERDKHTCVFCGKKKGEVSIQNSHFWGRGCKSLRFEPLNCDALCFYCHYKNEGNKQTEYREWKIKQLGIKKYNELKSYATELLVLNEIKAIPVIKIDYYEHTRILELKDYKKITIGQMELVDIYKDIDSLKLEIKEFIDKNFINNKQ